MMSWPSHSRSTRRSPKTFSNSGESASKSINVSLTSKTRTSGVPSIHWLPSGVLRLSCMARSASSYVGEMSEDYPLGGPALLPRFAPQGPRWSASPTVATERVGRSAVASGVGRLDSRNVRVVLRCFPSVVHAVVANDAHPTQAQLSRWREAFLEGLRGGIVRPRGQQDDIARTQH